MLPEEMASVSSVSSFERHLDRFWCDQDNVNYNHKADMYHRKSQCNNSISKVIVIICVYNRYVGWK